MAKGDIYLDDIGTYKKPFLTLVVLFLLFFGGFYYIIHAGEAGVLLTFGKASSMGMTPGFHLKVPLAQKVVKLETRVQKYEVVADSSSKDLQNVETTVALNFRLREQAVVDIYSNVGLAYAERIIAPAIQETVKAVTARFTAEELITKRDIVRNEIKEALEKKLTISNILVTDMNIVNFKFSEEFDKAIEQKVTAEQLKLKAENDLQRIKVEAEQKIAQARGEAEALRLQREQVTPELLQLRAIEKWNGILPQATVGMPFLDITPD